MLSEILNDITDLEINLCRFPIHNCKLTDMMQMIFMLHTNKAQIKCLTETIVKA